MAPHWISGGQPPDWEYDPEGILIPAETGSTIRARRHLDWGLSGSFVTGEDPALDSLIGSSTKAGATVTRWLLDNLWQGHTKGFRGLSVSRRREWWAARRLEGWPYSYDRVLQAVDHLVSRGLVIEVRAKPGAHRLENSEQSRIELTPRAIRWLEEHGGVKGARIARAGPNVRLAKRGSGESLRLPRNDVVRTLERDMRIINRAAAALLWQPPPSMPSEQRGDLLIIRPPERPEIWLNTGAAGYARLLTETGAFDDWTCGRMFGWGLQTLPRWMRRAGLVCGQQVVEVDFMNLHLRLVLAAAGLRCTDEDDLYDRIRARSSESRTVVKRAVNVALNVRRGQSAGRAIGRFIARAEEVDVSPDHMARGQQLLNDMIGTFPVLRRAVGTDAGVRLMRTESRILRHAGTYLGRREVALMPFHDAILAPASYTEITTEALRRAAGEVIGHELPTTTTFGVSA